MTTNERGRGRPNRQPQADAEVVRPNFGQHTPAIGELAKLLTDAIRYRDAKQNHVNERRKDLQEDEERLADWNRKIESYQSAIRALGGELPGEKEKAND
jgi:hypothetical protein